MISWIVASHDRAVFDANLGATLELHGSDELIVVDDPVSIAAGYNEGTARATQPVRCYVHHDLQLLDLQRLRPALSQACRRSGVGMVGVIGSRTVAMPWWTGIGCGSVVDSRHGRLAFDRGGCAVAILDGLLLATAQPLSWDEDYPGFHGYDHDACQQMLARGLVNWCVPNGDELVRHNTTGPRSMERLTGWDTAAARFAAKWGQVAADAP